MLTKHQLTLHNRHRLPKYVMKIYLNYIECNMSVEVRSRAYIFLEGTKNSLHGTNGDWRVILRRILQ